MKKSGGISKIVFWGCVALSLAVIAFYGLNPGSADPAVPDRTSTSAGNNAEPEPITKPAPNAPRENQPSGNAQSNKADSKNNPQNGDIAINITKSQISSQASFIPYTLNGVNMEIIAVKASDGTIRTALNTCQVCYDSGRGYYIQEGSYLVCQNCGNRFHIDQVEKIKGGCNPVPVMGSDKTDLGSTIALSKEFIATQLPYFTNWRDS